MRKIFKLLKCVIIHSNLKVPYNNYSTKLEKSAQGQEEKKTENSADKELANYYNDNQLSKDTKMKLCLNDPDFESSEKHSIAETMAQSNEVNKKFFKLLALNF